MITPGNSKNTLNEKECDTMQEGIQKREQLNEVSRKTSHQVTINMCSFWIFAVGRSYDKKQQMNRYKNKN